MRAIHPRSLTASGPSGVGPAWGTGPQDTARPRPRYRRGRRELCADQRLGGRGPRCRENASGKSSAEQRYTFHAERHALDSTLTRPNAQTAGLLGCSVAISGKTRVAGAPRESAFGLNEGAALTF
jgi:hypothetical protein